MAVVTPTAEQPDVGIFLFTFTPLANGDTGAWIDVGPYSDVCFEVYGTFGAGGNLRLEGTNDTTSTPVAGSILPVNDVNDTAINLTATRFKWVLESPQRLRFNVTAGDVTTALTVKLRMTSMARR